LQIPAFSRGKPIFWSPREKQAASSTSKKPQFVSPADMKNAVEKVVSTGNTRIILTERGSSFGYQNLVVDFRGIPQMNKFGYPVVFERHGIPFSFPADKATPSGGQPEFIEPLAPRRSRPQGWTDSSSKLTTIPPPRFPTAPTLFPLRNSPPFSRA